MSKTLLKWLLLTFLFAYVTVVTIWAHGEADRYVCQGFAVSIASSTSADTITINGVTEELMGYPKRIKGVPMTAINTLEIENYLSRLSNFEKVECTLSTDRMLKINITPMIPEIRVFDESGSYYINKDGKRIESKANFFVEVPVVSGKFTNGFTPCDVLPVTRFIQKDEVLGQLIGMVEANDKDNIILVPRIQGHVINFGDTNSLEDKRRALLTFYRRVIPYKGWEEYDTISLKFKGQIVATRRDKARNLHSLPFEEDIDPEEATLPLEAQVNSKATNTVP